MEKKIKTFEINRKIILKIKLKEMKQSNKKSFQAKNLKKKLAIKQSKTGTDEKVGKTPRYKQKNDERKTIKAFE